MKRAKNEFAMGQALFAMSRYRRDRKAPVRSGQVGVRESSNLFRKEDFRRRGHGGAIRNEKNGKRAAPRCRGGHGQPLNRPRPPCGGTPPSATGISTHGHSKVELI